MINSKVNEMIRLAVTLKLAINTDIQDVKKANHEKLLERNDKKLELMQEISKSHSDLNILLSQAIQNGEDVNNFRDIVNELEEHLRELYELNGQLAAIVLPVKQMYKEIIDEITVNNGGTLFEVIA
jgi:short-subunit dehydrogenase involved in D-alanine esterification of teichoic acids